MHYINVFSNKKFASVPTTPPASDRVPRCPGAPKKPKSKTVWTTNPVDPNHRQSHAARKLVFE